MKKIILFFGLLFFTSILFAQNSIENKKIYEDYGTFEVINGQNKISLNAFITIEKEDNVISQEQVPVKQKYFDDIKEIEEYHYEIYMTSKSIFNGDTTSTWLYGVKIFINGEDVLKKQFPEGFMIAIKTTPTLIHTHHAHSSDVEFEIEWEKSIYEPRIRK